jgi:hypothetical protein
MGIVLREVSDNDLARACEIEGAAYADNPLGAILNPGPFPPDSGKQRVPQLIETREKDPTIRYMQAYDEETDQMVAFAKWSIYDTLETAATAKRPARVYGPGMNREACEAFFGELSTRKERLMGGKPHLCKARPSTCWPHP